MVDQTLTKQKDDASAQHHERVVDDDAPVHDNAEQEPEFHWRTGIALASMCLIQFVQISSLLGLPTALTAIARDLDGANTQNWVVNVTTLAQAALGPIISSISDRFQARKFILVIACTIAMIGSAVAPGSQTIYRLIVAQVLVGLGLAAAPLRYAVPSEILTRKWRPTVQAVVNTCGSAGAVTAPLVLGALLKGSIRHWRYFYWMQMAIWGLDTIGTLIGYHPPKRHTRYDHLSILQKILSLDLIGEALLTAGVTLYIPGLDLGGNLFSWTKAQTLGPLVSGTVVLISFGFYETWGTSTGILDHRLFAGTTWRQKWSFAIFCSLFFLEGAMFFAMVVWYPAI